MLLYKEKDLLHLLLCFLETQRLHLLVLWFFNSCNIKGTNFQPLAFSSACHCNRPKFDPLNEVQGLLIISRCSKTIEKSVEGHQLESHVLLKVILDRLPNTPKFKKIVPKLNQKKKILASHKDNKVEGTFLHSLLQALNIFLKS